MSKRRSILTLVDPFQGPGQLLAFLVLLALLIGGAMMWAEHSDERIREAAAQRATERQAAAQTAAQAEDDAFDPAACSEDVNGKITVRLTSGPAFQLPWNGPMMAPGPRVEQTVGPDLPPLGCPDNPYVLETVSIPFDREEAMRRVPEFPWDKIEFRRFAIFGHDRPISSHERNVRAFDRDKTTYEACEITPEGLEVCLACDRQNATGPNCDEPITDGHVDTSVIAWIAVSPHAHHKDAAGRPFVVGCRRLAGGFLRECRSQFESPGPYVVDYEFLIETYPTDHLAAMDQEIRRQVRQLRYPVSDGQSIHAFSRLEEIR